MPESDQWNGDDELPDNGHGDLSSETGRSIRAVLGDGPTNVLNSDLGEERQTDEVFDGEETGDKPGSQGDANKAEQGKTTEERDAKKAEQEAKKAGKESDDSQQEGSADESVVTSKSAAKKAK